MRKFVMLFPMLLAFETAGACQVASQEDQDAADRVDLKVQFAVVRELVKEAEVVAVVRAPEAIAENGPSSFRVVRVLKGAPRSVIDATSESDIVVSCRASDALRNVRLSAGAEYLLYVRSGRILRAATTGQRFGELPYHQELRLVRSVPGA